MFYLFVCLCATCMPGADRGQKRVLDHLGLELADAADQSYEGWELNPGPLEQQQVFLTIEPLLHSSLNLGFYQEDSLIPAALQRRNVRLKGPVAAAIPAMKLTQINKP